MSKPGRQTALPPLDDSFLPKRRKPVPNAFVLDAIASLSPYTRPMFGCLAVYVKDKIVLILRDKLTSTGDNGVWLATTEEHHEKPATRISPYAIYSSAGQTCDRMASLADRRAGLRNIGSARL